MRTEKNNRTERSSRGRSWERKGSQMRARTFPPEAEQRGQATRHCTEETQIATATMPPAAPDAAAPARPAQGCCGLGGTGLSLWALLCLGAHSLLPTLSHHSVCNWGAGLAPAWEELGCGQGTSLAFCSARLSAQPGSHRWAPAGRQGQGPGRDDAQSALPPPPGLWSPGQ